jgi:hypothetical protein
MNCFVDENDNVIVDSNTILRQCIETIGKYSTKIPTPEISEIYFPPLPTLDPSEVVKLQKSYVLLTKQNRLTLFQING